MLRRTFVDPVLIALVLLSAALAVWGVWREALHPGMLGVLAIPFGIWLVVSTVRVQRPDVERRAERGVNSLADQRKAERGPSGGSTKKR